jgi:hypothetical protein
MSDMLQLVVGALAADLRRQTQIGQKQRTFHSFLFPDLRLSANICG